MAMDDNGNLKLKNRELLKFSKETLAYYIEITSLLYTAEKAIKDLQLIDRYFRSLEQVRRSNAIQQRLAEIDQEFLDSPNMSEKRSRQLMDEVMVIR